MSMSGCPALSDSHIYFRDSGFSIYIVTAVGYGLTESKADEEWTRFDRT